jgi:hypothetical protein
MNKSWLEHYRRTYYELLSPAVSGEKRLLVEGIYKRAIGFDIMFRLLLNQRRENFSIVETGTLRKPGNWKDGQSAALFTEFVDWHGGQMRSVDIDPEAVAVARGHIVSDKFSVACSDSVTWLESLDDLNQVDLYYLDSWDVKWDNDTDSANHHLKEFQVIEPHLKSGAVVAIDDNSRWYANNRRTGKGRAVVEYLETKGHLPIYDEYQIIFQF